MRFNGRSRGGFTVVELVIVIVIIAVLAALTTVVYNGIQRRAAVSTVESALSDVNKEVIAEELRTDRVPEDIPATAGRDEGVELTFQSISNVHYSNLSEVQNGVLFQSVCEELTQDPQYSTIHARSGGGTSSVVMECDHSISRGRLDVSAWTSTEWPTPVLKSQIESYIASVPYDSWWIDKQDVVRGFYGALISRFESRGGSWPITSFWDPWANPGNGGVQKEELPPPDPPMMGLRYCIEATHIDYEDIKLIVTSEDSSIRPGECNF